MLLDIVDLPEQSQLPEYSAAPQTFSAQRVFQQQVKDPENQAGLEPPEDKKPPKKQNC